MSTKYKLDAPKPFGAKSSVGGWRQTISAADF